MLRLLLFIVTIFLCKKHCVAATDLNHAWRKLIREDESVALRSYADFYVNGPKEDKELKISLDLISQDSLAYFCKFPARYMLLQEQFKLKKLKLSGCPTFADYINYFEKKNVSLVLSSEYINSPASSFGHIMLLFHNEDVPELDSSALHFAANPDTSDGLVRYMAKGVSGGYTGKFYVTPLFEKVNEYIQIEQRYMFFYTLDLSEEQQDFLIAQIIELMNVDFEYYFFSENCASKIDTILDLTYNRFELKNNLFPPIYVLPIDVLYNHPNRIKRYSYFTPYAARARYLAEKHPEDLKKIQKTKSGIRLLESSDNLSFKESIYYLYVSKFRTDREVLPNYKENILNATISNDDIAFGRVKDPLERSKPSMVQIETSFDGSSLYEGLRFRPVLSDIYNMKNFDSYEAQMSLSDIWFKNFQNEWKLYQWDLVRIGLVNFYSDVNDKISWNFYSGLNHLSVEENLVFTNKVGFGHGVQIFSNISLNYFISPGIDIRSMINIFIEPEVQLSLYLADNFKLVSRVSKKIYGEGLSFNFYENGIVFSLNSSIQFLATQGYNDYLRSNSGLALRYFF